MSLPVVEFELPACPRCGSAKLLAYRTTTHEDGGEVFAIDRHTTCGKCQFKFLAIYAKNSPDSGNTGIALR